jgi:hypothetical protein
VEVLQTIPSSANKDSILEAFASAFKILFGIMAAFSVVAGISSLGIRRHNMDIALDSEHILKQIKQEI